MFEWDYGSYNRKFAGTKALCCPEGGLMAWRPIRDISEDGCVWIPDEEDPLGEVLFECNGGKQTKLPLVRFDYVGIQPGMYAHEKKVNHFFSVTRRHLKSYKIGLSSEGYDIIEWAPNGAVKRGYQCAIDLTKPVTGKFAKYNILTANLLVEGKNLKAFGVNIGFMEDGKAILTDPALRPLVQPLLGDAWEIVNL